MEGKSFPETSVDFQQITRCYIPEDRTIYIHISGYEEVPSAGEAGRLPNYVRLSPREEEVLSRKVGLLRNDHCHLSLKLLSFCPLGKQNLGGGCTENACRFHCTGSS
jgi:hypothetical protein